LQDRIEESSRSTYYEQTDYLLSRLGQPESSPTIAEPTAVVTSKSLNVVLRECQQPSGHQSVVL